MLLPLIGLSQTKIDLVDFTLKSDTTKIYCIKMADITRMFAQSQLAWCQVWDVTDTIEVEGDEMTMVDTTVILAGKGKIAMFTSTANDTLILVSNNYMRRRYCVTIYFEIRRGGEKYFLVEDRGEYPEFFEKLDKWLRRAYVK